MGSENQTNGLGLKLDEFSNNTIKQLAKKVGYDVSGVSYWNHVFHMPQEHRILAVGEVVEASDIILDYDGLKPTRWMPVPQSNVGGAHVADWPLVVRRMLVSDWAPPTLPFIPQNKVCERGHRLGIEDWCVVCIAVWGRKGPR